jgi:hypothetical protein
MIQINLFNCSPNQYRLPLVKAALTEFSNIKEENKSKVCLVACVHHSNEDVWTEILKQISDKNIETYLAPLNTDEYIEKMEITKNTDTEYLCKWDDDIFINRHVWDYIIENVEILKDPSVSVLVPTLSNGIPTVELFIKDFLTKSEKQITNGIFLRDNITPNIWGCNYDKIISYINNLDEWDGDKYWEFVMTTNPKEDRVLPWYFDIAKGIHPARFSYDYNMFVANHAINNKHLVLDNNNYYLEKYTTPYVCNNLFISTTKFYKEAQTLFHDNWDEGQLTKLANNTGKSPIYVRNCYGIHMAYGCTENQREIEDYYINNLFNKI